MLEGMSLGIAPRQADNDILTEPAPRPTRPHTRTPRPRGAPRGTPPAHRAATPSRDRRTRADDLHPQTPIDTSLLDPPHRAQ